MNDKKIAVFFDCDNINAKYIDDVFNELANIGEVIIRQAIKIGLALIIRTGIKDY